MKVVNEISIADFNAWSGAIETKETIVDNCKVDEFDNMIEELYPDGLTDTQLNDLLWFDSEWIFETLGICEEEEEEEEEEEN